MATPQRGNVNRRSLGPTTQHAIVHDRPFTGKPERPLERPPLPDKPTIPEKPPQFATDKPQIPNKPNSLNPNSRPQLNQPLNAPTIPDKPQIPEKPQFTADKPQIPNKPQFPDKTSAPNTPNQTRGNEAKLLHPERREPRSTSPRRAVPPPPQSSIANNSNINSNHTNNNNNVVRVSKPLSANEVIINNFVDKFEKEFSWFASGWEKETESKRNNFLQSLQFLLPANNNNNNNNVNTPSTPELNNNNNNTPAPSPSPAPTSDQPVLFILKFILSISFLFFEF